jgi:cytochrome c-type biogenesis protein CcmF
MNIGEVMVVFATLTSLGACVTRFVSYRSGDKKFASASAALSLLTFVIISLTLVFLGYLFLSPDYGYYYVWSNSSSDLSTAYKISGIWSGADGSFLLWIWLMAVVLAVEVMLEPKRSYLSKSFHGLFQGFMAGILFLFMLILLDMNLFRETSAFQLQLAPNGDGMSILLQTPEMILHPPIVFAGYAFCIAAFSAGAAYLLTKEKNWTSVSLPWGRLAWLFLTLGIGIGAIWAYYVLGWGGYWAWDPVETASLLPWLIVTAFLHTQLRHSRKGEYPIISPALGMLSLVAVVFATFSTRAGSIWTSSVHAFGTATGTTAGARLSYLLQNDSTILGIFTLMLLLLAFALYISYDQFRRLPKKEEGPEPGKMSEYISDKNNMMVAVGLLIVTSAVMLFLLFKNVNVSQQANMTEFDQKMSLFFVATMVAMSVCLVWKTLGKDMAFRLGVGMLVLSFILAVAAAFLSIDWLVAFSVPSYAVAVGASVFKIVKARVPGSARKTLQKVGPQLVHLGVALVLLSFVVSTNMQVFPSDLQNISGVSGTFVNVGDQVDVSGYSVKLVDMYATSESGTSGGMTIDEGRLAVFDLTRSGDSLRTGIILSNLYGHDSLNEPHVMKVEVYIYKAITKDLYLNYQWVDNDTALVQVKLVPMMNFLWAGFGLLAIGLAVRTIVWRQEPKEKEVAEVETKAPDQVLEEKDYEAMVEEELRKFKEKRSK